MSLSTYLLPSTCALTLALIMSSCAQRPTNQTGSPRVAPKVARSVPSARVDVQVGDTVEVFVMEDATFNGSYKVRERGDIILPKIGRVEVKGLTPEAIQERLRGLLQADQLKSATVIVDRVAVGGGISNFAEAPKVLVFVTGSVGRPGQHMIALEQGDTLYAYEAILIAGGISPHGDERKAYVLRRSSHGARQRIDVDLRSVRQGTGSDVALSEGDMICVPARRFSL
jgi:polysaccharide biosynthesis/export protein